MLENFTSFIYKLLPLICVISFVRAPSHVSQSTASVSFPIIFPQNELKESAGKSYLPADDTNTCLLYIESMSAILYNVNRKMSAWATINSTSKGAKYSVSILCPTTHNIGQEFKVNLEATVEGEGVPGHYLGKNDKIIFWLKKIDIELVFNFTQSTYWQLVNVNVREIKLTDGEEKGIPSVDNKWSLVSGISSNDKGWLFTDVQSPVWNINGFKDYSYSCSRTSPIVWANKDNLKYAVGLAFHNFQFQLNSTYVDPNGVRMAKFGWRVNDCVPLFSIGTWMILLVFIILIGVLSFGFLMLNSVQTMSRFDDPKQKQIIINSKEN